MRKGDRTNARAKDRITAEMAAELNITQPDAPSCRTIDEVDQAVRNAATLGFVNVLVHVRRSLVAKAERSLRYRGFQVFISVRNGRQALEIQW